MNTTQVDIQPELPADKTKARKSFALWKILLPVFIGIAAVIWMFFNDAKSQNIGEQISRIHFSPWVIASLALGFLFMFGRDFGLTWRFRLLTDGDLKWKQAFKVTYLVEFTSAVTPSAVGGSALGMLYLNREGIEIGRATTLMLTTLFFDELFLVIVAPLMVLFTPAGDIFSIGSSSFALGLEVTFWLIYGVIAVWTLILFLGIIVWPNAIRLFLTKIFSLPLLRRWKRKVEAMGDNIVQTSAVLRRKPLLFWIKGFASTMLTWFSRYLVVNAIFLAFVTAAFSVQWLVLARQLVVWVLLMVSPTPGGAGLSEWLFTEVYGSLIPTAGLALFMAICWRLISYYVYLIIGSCIIPKWFQDTFSNK